MEGMKENIGKLEKMFEEINKHYFNDEIKKPVITLAKTSKKNVLGWCTSWKAWTDGKENNYEINIVADYADRPIEEIFATMIHECVHLHNLQNKIEDTSRNGSYHNKKFKETAEKRGLIIEKDRTYGWTITKLTEEAKAFCNENFNEEKLIYRTEPARRTNGTKKQNNFKHVCPNCGAIARTTKIIRLICGECFFNSDEEAITEMEIEFKANED